jgi:hypothetical protein
VVGSPGGGALCAPSRWYHICYHENPGERAESGVRTTG